MTEREIKMGPHLEKETCINCEQSVARTCDDCDRCGVCCKCALQNGLDRANREIMKLKREILDWKENFESLKSWVVHRLSVEMNHMDKNEKSVQSGDSDRQIALYVATGKVDAFADVLNRLNE